MIYLYHGSNVKIETIDLKKSRPNKDFGRGFTFQQTVSKHGEWVNLRH